jgi:hypothetical protein
VTQLQPQALGSLFIASYDSQGYGGGIRTRHHAGVEAQNESYFTTGGLPPISSSWRQVLEDYDQRFVSTDLLRS